MTVITIASAPFCSGNEIAHRLRDELGFETLTTEEIVAEAARQAGVDEDRVGRILRRPRSVFDRFTRDRERHLAQLRLAALTRIEGDSRVHHGPGGYLLPRRLPHVLRVGLADPVEVLVRRGTEVHGMSPREAEEHVQRADAALRQLTLSQTGLGPWDKAHFDVFLPMEQTTVERAMEVIVQGAANPAVRTDGVARKALADEILAARVGIALADAGKGDEIDVEADDGRVSLVINRYVTWLERFERELKRIAEAVSGVTAVETRIGPHYRRPNTYPGLEADVPRKILLVDDEAEFVETLSERLQTRNLATAVAYDGPEALAIAEDDAPDVMVVDMKMPGMGGLEVLRTIKRRHPHTEVIVLTAHGSDAQKHEALEMGAFAYLRKPADIDELAELMRAAYRKARGEGAAGGDDGASDGE